MGQDSCPEVLSGRRLNMFVIKTKEGFEKVLIFVWV